MAALASLQHLLRSALVVAGLLLIGVGFADTLAGSSKIVQYEELLRTTPPPVVADPAALFPTASESQERYDLARAKLGFYHLLLTVGQSLMMLGAGLIALGALRQRLRGTRADSDLPATN